MLSSIADRISSQRTGQLTGSHWVAFKPGLVSVIQERGKGMKEAQARPVQQLWIYVIIFLLWYIFVAFSRTAARIYCVQGVRELNE